MFSCTSEECQISLALFFDLVGGASIESLTMKRQGGGDAPSFDQFAQFFTKEEHHLFHRNDESKKFPVEVLYIKILAFLDLLKKVSAFHLRNQNIQFDLSDKSIIVSISSSQGKLPLLWNFSVECLSLEDQCLESINGASDQDQARPFENRSDDVFASHSSQAFNVPLDSKGAKSVSVFDRLGKILLRGLLGNDWNTIGEIDEHIKKMTVTLDGIASRELGNPDAMRNVVLHKMEQSKEVFASSNILYQEGDRIRLEGIIAEEIWDEIIIFALTVLTAESHPDFIEDKNNVNGPSLHITLDRFVNQLEEIVRVVKIELLHEQFQKKDIGEVLHAFLTADQSVNK